MAEKKALATVSKGQKVRQVLVQAAQGARRRLKKSGREQGLKEMAISGAIGYGIGYARREGHLDKLPLQGILGAGPEGSVAILAAGAYLATGNKWAEHAANAAIAISAYKKARNEPGRAPAVSGETPDLSGVEELGAVEVLD